MNSVSFVRPGGARHRIGSAARRGRKGWTAKRAYKSARQRQLFRPSCSPSSSSTASTSSSAGENGRERSRIDSEHIVYIEGLIRTLVSCLNDAETADAKKREFVDAELQRRVGFERAAGGGVFERCVRVVEVLRRRQRTSDADITRGLEFSEKEVDLLALLPLAGQSHVLLHAHDIGLGKLKEVATQLVSIESFYDAVGGVLGYQLEMLKRIREHSVGQGERAESGRDASISGDEFDDNEDNQKEKEDDTCEARDRALRFSPPPGLQLTGGKTPLPDAARRAVARGIASVPLMAEIYPMGGAADRLGLVDPKTLAPLPAAMLPYGGRSLLECLVRDLFAREYLHHAITGGVQARTPIAIMTSDVKDAHNYIRGLCETNDWFGRGEDGFRLFRQPLVPVADAATGIWLFEETEKGNSGSIVMKPGGHGALWKLCYDEQVLEWLRVACGRKAAFVRQVSNPMAGMDCTLFALGGVGIMPIHRHGSDTAIERALGFATCSRTAGASEGLNVLTTRTNADGSVDYGVGCVEYTEFERLAPELVCAGDVDAFPTNTNVLYVNLETVEKLVSGRRGGGGDGDDDDALPGFIMNLNKNVTYTEFPTGNEVSVKAGRLECTMQAIADALMDRSDLPLDMSADMDDLAASPSSSPALTPETLRTFAIYNSRRHVTSSAKRRRKPGSEASIAQTPDGSFRDLMLNARDLLERCGIASEPVGSVDSYLVHGPRFIFLAHPALGPVWDVIAQKLRGGALVGRSELVLEVAEADIANIRVDGSLVVNAAFPLGQACESDASRHLLSGMSSSSGSMSGDDDDIGSDIDSIQANRLISFGHRQPRVRLRNVSVVNKGIDWAASENVYWEHRIKRHESCSIELEGHSAFTAEDVTIHGHRSFVVPDGYHMTVSQDISPRRDGAASGGESQSLQIHLQRIDLPPNGDNDGLWRWIYSMDANDSIVLQMKEEDEEDTDVIAMDGDDVGSVTDAPATPAAGNDTSASNSILTTLQEL